MEAAAPTDPLDELSAAIDSLEAVVDVAVATDSVRAAELWRYREAHTEAVNSLGAPHKLDVTLPAAALAEFVERVPQVVAAAAPGARTWLFGHVADGNVHVNVTGADPDDDRLDEAVLRLAAAAGGSISAEHGIGTAKRRWLHLNRSQAEIAAFRAIKQALDPDGVLNPHVLLPEILSRRGRVRRPPSRRRRAARPHGLGEGGRPGPVVTELAEAGRGRGEQHHTVRSGPLEGGGRRRRQVGAVGHFQWAAPTAAARSPRTASMSAWMRGPLAGRVSTSVGASRPTRPSARAR